MIKVEIRLLKIITDSFTSFLLKTEIFMFLEIASKYKIKENKKNKRLGRKAFVTKLFSFLCISFKKKNENTTETKKKKTSTITNDKTSSKDWFK